VPEWDLEDDGQLAPLAKRMRREASEGGQGRAGREAHRRVAAPMLTRVRAGSRRSVSVVSGSSLFVDACSLRYARWYVSTPDGRVWLANMFILAAPALRRLAAPA